MSLRVLVLCSALGSALTVVTACGPSGAGIRECAGGPTDTDTDPLNCGGCGNACAPGFMCFGGECYSGECVPGTVEDCYTGPEDTLGVGPCTGGTRTCQPGGTWSQCEGEVTPVGEDGPRCNDGIDNNCNGAIDEDEDRDGDGQSTCGGDCCDSTECDKPHLVNSGAFDAPGNNFDDDCNGLLDDTPLLCDQNIASNTSDPLEFARAIDICQTTTEDELKWGVIDGSITFADGTGSPDPEAYAVRPKFGNGVLPQGGVNLAIISTGGAAAPTDTNPGFHPFESYTHRTPNESGFPQDFFAANNNQLPNAPGCPGPNGEEANDPVMLTFRIKVPTNAKSFKLSTNFFSAEFPEWTCSSFNDFFVVLLDSAYDGMPANPADKNLAFYQPQGSTDKFPVGVNLAYGDTGLFTQCLNGTTGCSTSNGGTISTCISTDHLTGTGFDVPDPGSCNANSVTGGATGWLVTSGNVVPGEIITLRIGIWDTSDHSFDSLAVIDGFQWSTDLANPGTVIERVNPGLDPLPASVGPTSVLY